MYSRKIGHGGGCCGPLVLLILLVLVVFAIVFVAPQTPTDRPAPFWYQNIEKFLHGGKPAQSNSNGKAAQRAMGTSQQSALSGSCFAMVRAAAVQAGIDPALYARQIKQESGCQSRICSTAGACGAAQLMPEMAASLGVDPMNVQQSLQAGAHLMAGYLKMHGGSWALALACYNAGTGRVRQALADYGAGWYAHLPLETQHYITAILGNEGRA
jgi:soluble lytic murein transglycosylase-like protein